MAAFEVTWVDASAASVSAVCWAENPSWMARRGRHEAVALTGVPGREVYAVKQTQYWNMREPTKPSSWTNTLRWPQSYNQSRHDNIPSWREAMVYSACCIHPPANGYLVLAITLLVTTLSLTPSQPHCQVDPTPARQRNPNQLPHWFTTPQSHGHTSWTVQNLANQIPCG